MAMDRDVELVLGAKSSDSGEDFPAWCEHLKELATEYTEKATNVSNNGIKAPRWVLYLKAHGLLNSCLRACPSDDEKLNFEKEIFELEANWYRGNHPLRSLEKLNDMTTSHKNRLKEIRRNTRKQFQDSGKIIQSLNTENVFSEANAVLAQTFIQDVKSHSESCTNDMIGFAKIICCSSEEIVGKPKSVYAVLGLGSIARNEITPYSDLEYAFLVEPESDKEYFTNLAVDTYFRISNLGETPLSYYFTNKERDEKWLKQDKNPSGFRIDGLQPHAGHIPTGNGLSDGYSLIVTVDQLTKMYLDDIKKWIALPIKVVKDAKEGRLSAVLASTVLIHSCDVEEKNQYGYDLLDEFIMKRMSCDDSLTEEECSKLEHTRVLMLVNDVEYYDKKFCGDDIQTVMKNIQIKPALFRYPTIVAHDLKIIFSLRGSTACEVFYELWEMDYIEKEVLDAFNFVVASAIWIRTSAYLYGSSQREYLSFHPQYHEDTVDNRFFVPKQLYIAMACRLVPIKKSILRCMKNNNDELPRDRVLGALRAIDLDKGNLLLQSRLHYLCGDYRRGLAHLHQVLGGNNVTDHPDTLLGIVPVSKYWDAAQLTAYLLFHNGHFAKAIQFFNRLLCKEAPSSTSKDFIQLASLTAIKAQCLMMLGEYDKARIEFDVAGAFMKDYLGVENRDEAMLKLFLLLTQDNPVRREIKLFVCVNSKFLADSVRYHQGRFNHTKDSYHRLMWIFGILTGLMKESKGESLVVADFNMALGLYNLQFAEYALAKHYLEMTERTYKNVFGATAATIDHSSIQMHLGTLALRCADYTTAKQLCKCSLDVLIRAEQKSPPYLLACHQMLAEVYLDCGEYDKALQHTNKCIEICEESRSEGYVFSDAIALTTQAQITYAQAMYEQYRDKTQQTEMLVKAKATIKKAIGVLKQKLYIKSVETHPDMSIAKRVLAELCLNLGSAEEAKIEAERALEGFLTCYGPDSVHPDKIKTILLLGRISLKLGQLWQASTHAENARREFLCVYERREDHPNMAETFYLFTEIERQKGNNDEAREYGDKSVSILKQVFGVDSKHPIIAVYEEEVDDYAQHS